MTTGLTHGERVVVVPVKTSPGWHYTEPHGVISRLGAGAVYADVHLDDGRDERVHVDSLQREKTHRRRTPPTRNTRPTRHTRRSPTDRGLRTP